MPTIAIRWTTLHRDPTDASDAMLATLSSLGVKFRGYHPVPGGFATQLVEEKDCDKAFSDECSAALLKVGLRVVVSPTHRARRTLIVHGVDSRTQESFEENFKKKYPKTPVLNTYIDKTRGNIKLIIGSLSEVDRLLKEGFKLGTNEYPPYVLARDQYHVIPECHSCYRLFPDHKTRNCPEKNIKLCSKCSSKSHRWNRCDSTDVSCVNCLRQGLTIVKVHETRDAMNCPIRNEALKKVRKENKLRAKSPAQPQPRTFPPAPAVNPWGVHQGPRPPAGGAAMGPPAPMRPAGGGKGKGGKGKKGKTAQGAINQGKLKTIQSDNQSQNSETDSQTVDDDPMNAGDLGDAVGLAKDFIGRADIAESQQIIEMAKTLGNNQVPKMIGDSLMSLLYGCVAEATRPGTFQKAINAAQTNFGLPLTKFPVYNHIFGRDNIVETKKKGKKKPIGPQPKQNKPNEQTNVPNAGEKTPEIPEIEIDESNSHENLNNQGAREYINTDSQPQGPAPADAKKNVIQVEEPMTFMTYVPLPGDRPTAHTLIPQSERVDKSDLIVNQVSKETEIDSQIPHVNPSLEGRLSPQASSGPPVGAPPLSLCTPLGGSAVADLQALYHSAASHEGEGGREGSGPQGMGDPGVGIAGGRGEKGIKFINETFVSRDTKDAQTKPPTKGPQNTQLVATVAPPRPHAGMSVASYDGARSQGQGGEEGEAAPDSDSSGESMSALKPRPLQEGIRREEERWRREGQENESEGRKDERGKVKRANAAVNDLVLPKYPTEASDRFIMNLAAKGRINEHTVIRRFIDKPSIQDLKGSYTTKIQVASQTIQHSQLDENPDSPESINSSAAESTEESEDSLESDEREGSDESSGTVISPGQRTVGTNDSGDESQGEGDTRYSQARFSFLTPEPLLTDSLSTFISQQPKPDEEPRHSSPIDSTRGENKDQGLDGNLAISPIPVVRYCDISRSYNDDISVDGSNTPSDDGLSQLDKKLMTEKYHKYETRSQAKSNL